MNEIKTFRCTDRQQWREWLAEHFETETEIWFVFPTKDTGEQSVSYNDAVEEALCFGWIDGRAGTLDAKHQLRRFTPRGKGSAYSRPNTTAETPDNSAAKLIQQQKYQEAFEKLKDVAENSSNQTNLHFYVRIKSLSDSILLRLVKRIRIISSASDITDVEQDIQKQIRYSCKLEHVPLATERIEGWWFQECIKALSSTNPIITTYRQLHAKVYEIILL